MPAPTTSLMGVGQTSALDPTWETGYSASSIAADTVVAHSSNSGSTFNLNEAHTAYTQATGATLAATLGRLLYNVAANSTSPGGGPLELFKSVSVNMTTTGATVGDPVFLSDTGTKSLTSGTFPKVIGWVDKVGGATSGIAYISPASVASKWFTHDRILADSTAITNTVTNTAFSKTITIPARHFFTGRRLVIRGCVRFSATHSTDTATIQVLLGTLALFTSAAVDVADNDTFSFVSEVTMRGAFSATAEVVGESMFGFSTSAQNVKTAAIADASAVDNTGSLAISVKLQWSVADTGNSAFLESLSAEMCLP